MPKCFTLKFTQENTVGADSLFTRVSSWETSDLCRKILDPLTRNSSNRTPRLIMSCTVVPLTPRKQPIHTASFLKRFSLSRLCIFSLGHCRVICWVGGAGNGTPLQYSCLENPMDGGAWWAAVLGVAKSRTRLRDFTFTFHFHALEKEMATHSSVLAWRVPEMGEPGGLPSMGSHRVGHN